MDNNEKSPRWGVKVPFLDSKADWLWVCEENKIEDQNWPIVKTFDTEQEADKYGQIFKTYRVEIYDDRARTTGQE
tara:strand:- start:4441 stop:4665 length:225 start_codon:yes stop_codon:yes gene_type:complete